MRLPGRASGRVSRDCQAMTGAKRGNANCCRATVGVPRGQGEGFCCVLQVNGWRAAEIWAIAQALAAGSVWRSGSFCRRADLGSGSPVSGNVIVSDRKVAARPRTDPPMPLNSATPRGLSRLRRTGHRSCGSPSDRRGGSRMPWPGLVGPAAAGDAAGLSGADWYTRHAQAAADQGSRPQRLVCVHDRSNPAWAPLDAYRDADSMTASLCIRFAVHPSVIDMDQ
jgi:hypothetical protein